MTGKVYIANISASAATYSINNTPVSTPARPMNSATCTPYFVIVARSRYPDPSGTFAMGSNDFSVQFADTIPPEHKQIDCVVVIPDSSSIDDDLILYVFRNSVSLLSSRGIILPDTTQAA
ncbi:hypothetical protein [Xanthomonas hortorum]|uniref:hypothetical protein n=1 Tax=Xanthomonas hortorum TaxID=56454 RepID=UPI0029358195|nr:hypothetical protein [Xanthomonas hortorum]MDV2451826.1 hypothetical protein [Xanthomonas hortorum NBC5720]